MQYRRYYIPGGTYFFTLVTFHRKRIFSFPGAVCLLEESIKYVHDRMPFVMIASVILPDHLHQLWKLPPESSDFSTSWRLIKSHFSRNFRQSFQGFASTSRNDKGEVDIWQPRFWEHLIRNEQDLENHIDYIHFNPVKHGLSNSPSNWEHSSFKRFVNEGFYPPEWGQEKVWPGDPRME
jgi:putative transposase